MNAHVLQHVPFEDIGSMKPWLAAREFEVTYTRFFQDGTLPDPDDFDLVIAMGGPMSVNDESKYPWLRREKAFVRDAIQSGVPFVGVCLGSQLIASALGSRVYRNAEKEIGWFPIESTAENGGFRFPDGDVFHWHGETFDLPEGAVHLARSGACRNQAFQIGSNVIGMQFHLETTPDSAWALVEHFGDALTPGPFVQSEAELLAVSEDTYTRVNGVMGDVLAYVLGEGNG